MSRTYEQLEPVVSALNERIAGLKSAFNFTSEIECVISDGYYDTNSGGIQAPSGYWQEKRTSIFDVENVNAVFWKFVCASSVTQKGVSLSEWKADGSFIGKKLIVSQSVYSEQSGTINTDELNEATKYIAFDFSTRGQEVSFLVNCYFSSYRIDKGLQSIEQKINGIDVFTIDCDYQTYSGGYIKASDGKVANNSSTGYTSYIDVSAFSEISSPIDHVATYQMAFYDANKSYLSGETKTPASAVIWKIQVPNGAKYARLSFYLDVENTFYAKGVLNDFAAYVHSLIGDSDTKLKGKKLGIIGDSISTYSGYIPSGYAVFYPRNTVTDVEKTWWKQLLNETGMDLCVNASWSGSTISGDTTREDGYVGCSDARVNALTDGNGNKPDIIIVWMGINDFGKTNGITCGSYDGTTAVSTATNITAITEAYGVLLKKLESTYPNAQIFVCRILPEQFASEMSASYTNGFPNINPNDNISLPELNDRIEQIANAFGCGVIPMDKCGATFFNINTYTGDGLHPNALLTPKMCEVAKQTLLQLVN